MKSPREEVPEFIMVCEECMHESCKHFNSVTFQGLGSPPSKIVRQIARRIDGEYFRNVEIRSDGSIRYWSKIKM